MSYAECGVVRSEYCTVGAQNRLMSMRKTRRGREQRMIPQLLASTRPAQSMLLDVGMLLPAALHPGVAYADAPADEDKRADQ